MNLLTRPYLDSKKLANILGQEYCFIEPMVEIEQLETDLSNYINKSIQAIVTTSKNVKSFSDVKIPDHGKNAKEVLDYCLQNLSPKAGKILYLSGDKITLDIADELNKNGFDSDRIITYKQIYPEKLTDAFLRFYKQFKTASFFSKQTLKNFLQLAEKHNINTEHMTCVCISEDVSRETSKDVWKDIKIAKEPNLDGMLDVINSIEY